MDNENSKNSKASSELIQLTTSIVSSFVSNNPVPVDSLPDLIKSVHNSVTSLAKPDDHALGERPKPAVPINRSVTEDHIVCLEDGKKLKMLKRYLRSHYGLTPDDYRKRWGLPADYPMVAPSYTKKRSDFAKKSGLGKVRSR